MSEIFGAATRGPDETTVIRASETEGWTDSGVPGFPMRLLHQGRTPGETTYLMRIDPGALAETHAHETVEQVHVIAGSFSDDSGTYTAGDHLVRPPGSAHRTWSDDGALVLLVYTCA